VLVGFWLSRGVPFAKALARALCVVGLQTKKQRTGSAKRRLRDDRSVSCTTFNILAPIYKRLDSEVRYAALDWISLCSQFAPLPQRNPPPARFSSRWVGAASRLGEGGMVLPVPEMADALFLVAIVGPRRTAGRASTGPTGSAATRRSSTASSPAAPPSSASR
jgi:hypothetical protein